MRHPQIIQGGMGVAISNWRLARTVSQAGQLGVVSGVGLDTILLRRLQDGDGDGSIRRAMAAFPLRDFSRETLDRYFVEGGKAESAAYPLLTKPNFHPTREQSLLVALAAFVEVWLAKEGHAGLVGFNLLEKIQLPTLASLLGAMLAGVDYVLMGAGIPREIPGALDALSKGETATLTIHVEGNRGFDPAKFRLDPKVLLGAALPALKRPYFLAIVASVTLARTLARKANGYVNGFVIERPTAGGHNAPPRGKLQLDENGEPIYGPRDVVDLEQIRQIGRPFWLAGSSGNPDCLREVKAMGGVGIQLGTAFALCRESGMASSIKSKLIEQAIDDTLDIRTDARSSPTGFPFKLAHLEGTLSEGEISRRRTRICDLGYLRTPYRTEGGKIGFRCPSEPLAAFERKGGEEADTVGRQCLCNGLMANADMAQHQKFGGVERALVTIGEDFKLVRTCLRQFGRDYSALDVLAVLLESEQDLPAGREWEHDSALQPLRSAS